MAPADLATLQPQLVAVARFAAVLVLACETLVLWTRRERTPASAVASRLVWALTPAAVLVGLSLWCAAASGPRTAPEPSAVALLH